MKLNVITNSRPTQDLGEVLVAACTEGQIRISPDFGDLIGVVDGEYMGLGKDADGKIFAFKGNGDEGIGNKLAKSGSFLQMSSKNAWNVLGGNTEENRFFEVVGDVVEDEGIKYAEISFKDAEPKQERKSADSKVEDKKATEEQAAEVTEDTDGDEF